MNVGLWTPLNRVWSIMRAVGYQCVSDSGFFLSSALAFNLLRYFIPLSLFMISLLSYTVLGSEQALREVQSVLRAFLPRSPEVLPDNLAEVVANRGLLGVAGFVSVLLFNTFLFGTARTVLNRVFEVRQARPFVHGLWVDVLMIGSTACLFYVLYGFAPAKKASS
jgi:uncharacterized BrkB/YihY/UPF0761 family membrane protein